ncbi:MAG: amidohydrolase family protein [Parvularculaceae bacterium]|nr:amidohydrolase family protein [Parvularculaceae bacterium]
MIIDTQTHYQSADVKPVLARWAKLQGAAVDGLPEQSSPAYDRLFSLDARLAAMDAHGVDVSVLSPAPLGVCADQALANEFAAAANDSLIAACGKFPSRFVALARLPLPDVEASLREAQRIAGAACIRGISVPAQTTLYKPDEIGFERVLRYAAERNWLVVLHPPAGVCDLSDLFSAYGLSSGLHAMMGSVLTLSRIVFSGMLDRIDELNLLVTHFGGGAPFFSERLDSRGKGAKAPFSEYLRTRIYFDNCGYTDARTLAFVLGVVGAGRIVLGSDWPSRPISDCLAPLGGLAPDCKNAILGETAQRWFRPIA